MHTQIRNARIQMPKKHNRFVPKVLRHQIQSRTSYVDSLICVAPQFEIQEGKVCSPYTRLSFPFPSPPSPIPSLLPVPVDFVIDVTILRGKRKAYWSIVEKNRNPRSLFIVALIFAKLWRWGADCAEIYLRPRHVARSPPRGSSAYRRWSARVQIAIKTFRFYSRTRRDARYRPAREGELFGGRDEFWGSKFWWPEEMYGRISPIYSFNQLGIISLASNIWS